MCSERKTWPARMVAAVMTLALVLATALAAHEHAAGHHHVAASAAHHSHAHNSDGFDDRSGPGHVQATHEDGTTRESGCGTDPCNCMCTGGCAILAAAAVMESPLPAAPAIELAVPIDGTAPDGVERPPKASIPA
jgi:hypothetical protein